MRTLNVWRQLIAVVRHLAYPAPATASPLIESLDAVAAAGEIAAFAVPTQGGGEALAESAVVTMEAHGRTWYKGPPPHVGWWNAARYPEEEVAPVAWRWWDGKRWSKIGFSDELGGMYEESYPAACVWWNDYYPEDAVVPRMTPEQWKEKARAST